MTPHHEVNWTFNPIQVAFCGATEAVRQKQIYWKFGITDDV
jgi:hypothetical protein